jgi:hypothetical protein
MRCLNGHLSKFLALRHFAISVHLQRRVLWNIPCQESVEDLEHVLGLGGVICLILQS